MRPIAELSPAEVEELLRAQVVGRIGCHADGSTYVVPVIYAYDDGAVYVASLEGRKVRMMRQNPSVCFEVDEYERPGSWRSVIAQGAFEELSGASAEHALTVLADRFRGLGGEARRLERPRRPDGSTVCFRIRIAEATGRAVGTQSAAEPDQS